jgi:hypothetical protein
LSCLGIIEKAFAHAHLQAIRGWPGEISGLSESRSDAQPTNAVALCPNCHRALHYSVARQELIATLYENVTRLIKE